MYPILDSAFSADLLGDAKEAIRAGIEMIQIRAKNLTKARILEIVEQLEPICSDNNTTLIVNDHADIVLVSRASGVHLGQEDFPVLECRRILPERIIGISTHNKEQFSAAVNLPVDYIAVGPVYETSTKHGQYEALGASYIRAIRPLTRVPIVCIGGIRKGNIAELLDAGANGIAMISELYRGQNLYSSILDLLEVIRR